MGASFEIGVITRPVIFRHCLVGAIPLIVVVVWACGDLSFSLMSNWAMAFGSTNERVAWSSMMASPSTERPDLGYLRLTGHVRLNDWVNSVCP